MKEFYLSGNCLFIKDNFFAFFVFLHFIPISFFGPTRNPGNDEHRNFLWPVVIRANCKKRGQTETRFNSDFHFFAAFWLFPFKAKETKKRSEFEKKLKKRNWRCDQKFFAIFLLRFDWGLNSLQLFRQKKNFVFYGRRRFLWPACSHTSPSSFCLFFLSAMSSLSISLSAITLCCHYPLPSLS